MPKQPEPIQEEHRALMGAIADTLDDLFNGEDCRPEDRKVWFFLACGNFKHSEARPQRFNYISNAEKISVAEILRDVLSRIEARMSDDDASREQSIKSPNRDIH